MHGVEKSCWIVGEWFSIMQLPFIMCTPTDSCSLARSTVRTAVWEDLVLSWTHDTANDVFIPWIRLNVISEKEKPASNKSRKTNKTIEIQ